MVRPARTLVETRGIGCSVSDRGDEDRNGVLAGFIVFVVIVLLSVGAVFLGWA